MAEKEEKEEKRIIKEKEREKLENIFQELENPVNIIFFTQENECLFCRETHQILTEVSEFNQKIRLTVHDFQKDPKEVSEYSIDKIPATVVTGEKKYGIRFFGVPSGYEFTSLVTDIITVSQRRSILQPETKEKLAALKKDVHIQVFTTPTCPYCLQAVQTAHQFALQSDTIISDMVGSVEFPHLAHKYDVFGVPKIIINETHSFEGVLPEEAFADKILKAV
jgi:glutaredoxin-like protein